MRSEGAEDDDARTFDSGQDVALALPDDDIATIAVLGAVGPDKGARRLERLADLVRETGARVRFVLIGYMDVQHGPWQSDDAVLTVHGRYDPRELPALFARYRVSLVAYPSAGPETFSFTLSEAWAAGRPVFVPPFGALARAARGHRCAGWAWTDDEWRDEAKMLERIVAAVAPEHAAALAARVGMRQPRSATDAGSDGGVHARALRQGRSRPDGAPTRLVVRSSGARVKRP